MSSYYNRIQGTLETGKTARADDIHLIQSSTSRAIRDATIDIGGTSFILGGAEDAFKLYATNQHTDQSNLNYNENGCWVSFYDKYLRQPIDIDKSSIESIRVQMMNDSHITTTVYAEIRDEDFELVKEAHATLPKYTTSDIEFYFNLKHISIGRYYLVIRPVDISSTDLAKSGDEIYYDEKENYSREEISRSYFDYLTSEGVIQNEYFLIKYDADGNYNKGLEASYDGSTYLNANLLEDGLTVDSEGDIESENNPDLYFEEIFSSGNTYLIKNTSAAVVLGEKVYPLDTHVTIDAASNNGDRTDLVTLTTDGHLVVTKGAVYTDPKNKNYPVNTSGLNIAYITTYKASKNKLPFIEQDDENGLTRQRDILERLRRVEKKINYQVVNNSPTRIQYNCGVDPILANNGVDDDSSIKGEGTYGMGTQKDANGNLIATDDKILNYAWSIIKNNYTYNVETKTNENGKITVWDTYTTETKDKNYTTSTKGLYRYHAEVMDHSTATPVPVKNLELKIQIKKGGKLKKTYTKKTNSDGQVNLTFFSLKLAQGTYTIYTIYNNVKIKSKLIVYKNLTSLNNKKENTHSKTVTLEVVSGTSVTRELPEGVIPGNDSFYLEKMDIDTDKGEVKVSKISNISDAYEVNNGRALLKDIKKYKSSDSIFLVDHKTTGKNTAFPALHVTFDRDAYIKSITPYIEGFQNIKSFGILIFKNDDVHNRNKNAYTKKIKAGKVSINSPDDTKYPTLYKSKYVELKDITKKSGNYRVLNKQVTFDNINLNIEAGTYTIMICPKLDDTKKDGNIKIKQYKVKNDINIYGSNESVYGNYKMSQVYINPKSSRDTSWDVAIKHKTYRYYDSGLLQSKPINTGLTFTTCHITKNISIPKQSSSKYELYVSNDGGTSWQKATEKNDVIFKSANSSFRWKLEFYTDNMSTPKLKFNPTRQYAINFSLGGTGLSTVEYEDFGRCYETPIFNANSITRNFTRSATANTFTEWEFARIFMEDSDLNSKIDILISYAYDDYSTSVSTDKEYWKKIFFSTIFADLTLNDFTQKSINYDNYDGNVEYDEYNYRFSLDTEDVTHHTGGRALATPLNVSTQNLDVEYVYGDINESSMGDFFNYQYIDEYTNPYTYVGNTNDEEHKYSGMHITSGPYYKAEIRATPTSNNNFTSDDTIVGVRFNHGLDIDENITYLRIGLMPHIVKRDQTDDESALFFPAGTFKISLSLGEHGEGASIRGYETEYNEETGEYEYSLDSNGQRIPIVDIGGKDYIINQDLYNDTYTEININFIDDFDTFEQSGINSIALKLCNPDTFPMQKINNEADSIGMGRIVTGSYNIRPYVPYMYTGSHDRLKWQKLVNTDEAQAFSIYTLGKSGNVKSSSRVFYPIINDDKKITRIITENTDKTSNIRINNNNNEVLQMWSKSGTNYRKLSSNTQAWGTGKGKNHIERKNNQITTYIGTTKYVTKDTGNEILFQLPQGVTGDIFSIDTNIPYKIYDLVDIEYYMFTQYWKNGDAGYSTLDNDEAKDKSGKWNIHKITDSSNTNNGNIYYTDGSFSKGEIFIDLYTATTEYYTTDEGKRDSLSYDKLVESFALPAWGRVATRSEINNKCVHSWFKCKEKGNVDKITKIVLRRENPRNLDKNDIKPIKLVLNNILFFNAEYQAALGPQMQMRIYPSSMQGTTNTKIRKTGGIYRI